MSWAAVLAALGVMSLVVSGVWWVLTPRSERFVECTPNLVRNGCSNLDGGLVGPTILLTLGLLLLVLAAGVVGESWWRNRDGRRSR